MPAHAAPGALAPAGALGTPGGSGALPGAASSGSDGLPGARLAGFKRRAREDAGGSSASAASGDAARGGPGAGAPAAPQRRSAANKHQVCSECGTDTTPTWRRNGPALLCNACGLRRRKLAAAAAS
jgi:membrane protease subunit (stomatin/prohibitin family)